MRKICTLLMIASVNLSFSQDPRIFNNVWRLTNVIVNGVDNITPNGNMNINFTSPTEFYAIACNTMAATVVFENNNTNFSASNYLYTLNICTDPPAENYQNIYFPFFLAGSNPDPLAVFNFTYTISELLEGRTLIINSINNEQAVYSNVMLSNDNFEKLDFSFSPNPSNDYLTVNINNGFTEKAIAEFYNEIGQICKTAILNQNRTKIEINNLSNGVYIVKIKTENEVLAKKFIKL